MKFIFLKTTTGNVTSDCLPDISFHAEPAPRPQERAEKQMTSKPAPFFLVCMCVCVCMYFCERRKEEHQGQSVRNGRQNSLTPWRRSVAWEIARGKRLHENSLIRSLSLSLSLSHTHTHIHTDTYWRCSQGELENISASFTFSHVSQPKTVNAQKQTVTSTTLAV